MYITHITQKTQKNRQRTRRRRHLAPNASCRTKKMGIIRQEKDEALGSCLAHALTLLNYAFPNIVQDTQLAVDRIILALVIGVSSPNQTLK